MCLAIFSFFYKVIKVIDDDGKNFEQYKEGGKEK
jgi:hypothetical protein